ncbi:hypothetical protein [Achromobacter mucicolens]|uniref:hypothetical protein n=1 Tax=Achromobacter mucicolens TaxID=1389922 RepID=UPI00289DEFDD|nr:hypothetical protein [Achromobacter mucicolens]
MNKIYKGGKLLCLSALFVFSSFAGAVDIPKAPNLLQPLEVTVIGDSTNRVGNPVFLTLVVKNVSSTTQILTNVAAEIDDLANSRFDGGGFCTLETVQEPTLAPGEAYSQTCRFPVPSANRVNARSTGASTSLTRSANPRGWSNQSWYDSLFNANLRLFVDVGVQGIDPTDGPSVAPKEPKNFRFFPVIPVQASELCIFVGGAVGAMLLAVFVWVERLLKNPEVRERWAVNIFVTFLAGLRGAILSAIALLLGQMTQVAGSPVVLTVTDFSGGLLIGLFSYPLAAWISATLRLDDVFVFAKNKEVVSVLEGNLINHQKTEPENQ